MANIFLAANDTFTLPSTNTNDTIFGRTGGTETVILQGNPQGTILDGNVEEVQVAGTAAATTLQVNANGQLELSSGGVVYATFSGGLNQAVDLQFTDGNVTLTQTGSGTFTIEDPANAANNVTINSTTSQAGNAVTLGSDTSTAGGGTGGGTPTGNVLTQGADNLLGDANDNTFTAPISTNTATGALADTAQSVDIVNGAGGTDTLSITSQAGGAIAPTLASVENVELKAFNAQTFNAANTTGLKSFTNNGSVATITVTNLADIVDLTVSGVTGNTTSLNYLAGAATTTSDTQKITVSGASNDHQIDFNSGTASIENFEITSSGSANSVDLTDVAGMTSLKVSGDQALKLNFTNTVNGLTSVDTTAATGAMTLDLSTNVGATNMTVKTGTANDSVTFANLTKDDSIDLGAGEDKVTLNIADAVTLPAASLLNVETLDLNLNSDNDDAQEDSVINLSLATALKTVEVGATTAATKTNEGQVTLASLAAGATTLNLKGDGAAADTDINDVIWSYATTTGSQTLNINVSNNDGNGNPINSTKGAQLNSAVTANGVETIALATTQLHGDATGNPGGLKMALTADALKTLTVESASTVDLSGNALASTVSSVDASKSAGNVSLNILDVADSATTGTKSVTVTTGSGNDTVTNITGAVGTTVSTGDGNDTISTEAATAFAAKVSINAGAGNDTVDISNEGGTTAEKTITLGAGNDTIKIESDGTQTKVVITDFATGTGGDVLDLLDTGTDITVGGTGAPTDYKEAGVFTGANAWGGMNVYTDTLTTLDAAGLVAALTADTSVTVAAADAFFIIASNGVDAGLFRMVDANTAGTIETADVTLVGTFNSVSDASGFAVQNFADFLA